MERRQFDGADELWRTAIPQRHSGSEFASVPQFALCENYRIIRGLDWRSAYGTLFLPKLARPVGGLSFDGTARWRRRLAGRMLSPKRPFHFRFCKGIAEDDTFGSIGDVRFGAHNELHADIASCPL
jgi:hypothetical protein